MSPHPLDRPAWASLTGPHAHVAQRRGDVLRYPADVSPFLGMPSSAPTARDWVDAAALVGPGGLVPLAGLTGPPPEGWLLAFEAAGVQFVDDGVDGVPDRRGRPADRGRRPGDAGPGRAHPSRSLPAPDRRDGRLRRHVHGIHGRGETAFLHAAATNTPATDLYGSLGFRFRREVTFAAARVPG